MQSDGQQSQDSKDEDAMRLKAGVDLDGKIYDSKHTTRSSLKRKTRSDAFQNWEVTQFYDNDAFSSFSLVQRDFVCLKQ